MAKVLIIAEHNGSVLNPATAKCVTCAAAIDGAEIDILILASSAAGIAAEAAKIDGVNLVLTAERAENENPVAALQAPQVVALAEGYSHVFGPSTTFGKDLMPRVAALLGVNQISDIMSIEGTHSFKRPIYAGNVVVTVEAPADKTLVATVRTASYQAPANNNSAAIEAADCAVELPTHTRFVEARSGDTDRPDLQIAARVVAGGRALASEENFDLIFKLADALGAGVGSSRAAVDAGYIAPETQIGQTG